MSRKLDALFAERVLGCKVEWKPYGYRTKEPNCCCERNSNQCEPHGSGDTHGDWAPYLAYYTDSLDAAWEGVEKLGDLSWELMSWDRVGPHKWRAHVEGPNHHPSEEGNAQTPALAIVLACLRACGVSEEEIKEAQG